ncbi:MAG: hypothetical protein ACE5F5_05050 [Acidimicrobiia bacterium]
MYRLAELSDARRRALGAGMLIAGLLGLVVAVIWVHWASFPLTETVGGVDVPVVVPPFDWIPRGALSKGFGYLLVLGAATLSMAGAAVLWLLNQTLTWSRAAFAAFLAWIALVFYFGIVPSEWLNFAQTDLEWSSQTVAFTIPSWLVLGNEVGISFGAIKDAISGGYHIVMLGVGAVFAIQIQRLSEGRPASAAKPEPKSPYGRPLVKGGS